MLLEDLEQRSSVIRQAYHELEISHHQKQWSIEEDLLALTNDIGNLVRLVMTKQGRYYDETPYSLEQKLAENIWWLVSLSQRLEIDLQAELEKFCLKKKTYYILKDKGESL